MTQSLVRLIHTMGCPIDDMIVGSINAPRKKERKEGPRYYGEVVLVATVVECPFRAYEAFSPPQTPTALRSMTEGNDITQASKTEQERKEKKGIIISPS